MPKVALKPSKAVTITKSKKKYGGRGPDLLAGIFTGSALLHFLIPKGYEKMIPPAIPKKREIVYASGVAEALSAVGLWRRWKWGGTLGAAILVAVFPANVQMLLDAGSGKSPGPMDDKRLLAARLPLQIPMLWWAWKVHRKH
jgi:uncharacterized membrane protein